MVLKLIEMAFANGDLSMEINLNTIRGRNLPFWAFKNI